MEQALPRCKPEDQGVSSSSIASFVKAVEEQQLELHSFMLLRNGHLLSEQWWPSYGPESQHALYSISKSFTSTAIGLAVAEGLLSIEDRVLPFFPNEVTPQIEQNMGALKVKHLLTMATGHAEDPSGIKRVQAESNWVRGFLETPIVEPPGTRFLYNSGASYMLSAILHQVTGQSLLDYLQPRLFEPLGIVGAVWEACPQGRSAGGWGLSLRTEDLAKFGQLYLQQGEWNEKQLLSREWVKEATRSHISTAQESGIDKQQGYGYQFYLCRFGAYTARGAFGQFCMVLPEQGAVVVITATVNNMQGVLDLVWEHLLVGMG
ncbi:serine hydrolase domain-containing protein [Paenibacillus agricola]|nr:serine hydrolase [Paenibacillus agricola]